MSVFHDLVMHTECDRISVYSHSTNLINYALSNLYFVDSMCQGQVYKNEVIQRSWHQEACNLMGKTGIEMNN